MFIINVRFILMNAHQLPNNTINQLTDTLTTISQRLPCKFKMATKNSATSLCIDMNKTKVTFAVYWFDKIISLNIHAVANFIKTLSDTPILITSFLNKELAHLLIDNQVEFIDLCGNIYINRPPLYIQITGEKPPVTKKQTSPARAFGVAGIKVIFACLNEPGLENTPYRNIANISQVSLGVIDTVFSALKDSGYLVTAENNQRSLINKKDLLNRWCIAYSERLRSKLICGHYNCDKKNWWHDINIKDYKAVWGGEVAAAKLTKYLKPEIITLYAQDSLPKLRAKYALTQHDDGNIEILKPVANAISNNAEVVSPLLVYADLIISNNDRNKETAEIIYEKYIAKLIE